MHHFRYYNLLNLLLTSNIYPKTNNIFKNYRGYNELIFFLKKNKYILFYSKKNNNISIYFKYNNNLRVIKYIKIYKKKKYSFKDLLSLKFKNKFTFFILFNEKSKFLTLDEVLKSKSGAYLLCSLN